MSIMKMVELYCQVCEITYLFFFLINYSRSESVQRRFARTAMSSGYAFGARGK